MNNQQDDITQSDVSEILELVNQIYGYDFRRYAKASMHRRIQKFIIEMKFESAFELKFQLTNYSLVFTQFLQRITVNVTEMFRDPSFFIAMKEHVIPKLSSYPVIKIWHPGCSSGEEVFSLAILLHEANLLERTRIYATDINPENIAKAKEGILAIELMKEYAANYHQSGGINPFSNYYTANHDYVVIKNFIQKNIFFSHHNLVTDKVFNEFQMICCRNVMIYFNKDLQEDVVDLLFDSLSPLGYLALGLKENLPFTTVRNKFSAIDKTSKIYRRNY